MEPPFTAILDSGVPKLTETSPARALSEVTVRDNGERSELIMEENGKTSGMMVVDNRERSETVDATDGETTGLDEVTIFCNRNLSKFTQQEGK